MYAQHLTRVSIIAMKPGLVYWLCRMCCWNNCSQQVRTQPHVAHYDWGIFSYRELSWVLKLLHDLQASVSIVFSKPARCFAVLYSTLQDTYSPNQHSMISKPARVFFCPLCTVWTAWSPQPTGTSWIKIISRLCYIARPRWHHILLKPTVITILPFM